MVYVHRFRGEVVQAPVTPGVTALLYPCAEPRRRIMASRPAPTACTSGTNRGKRLVLCVVNVAASAASCRVGALNAWGHGSPPGRRCRGVPAPGLEPGNSAGCFRVSPRGPVPRTSSRWVSGHGRPSRRTGPDVVGGRTGFQPRSAHSRTSGLLMGGTAPARCLTTPAATPSNAGCVVHEQRLSPRADTQTAVCPPVGRVRGNPAPGKLVREGGTRPERPARSPLLLSVGSGPCSVSLRTSERAVSPSYFLWGADLAQGVDWWRSAV